MELAEYHNIFESEESHFFYVSLHRLILRLVNEYLPKRKLMILDAGCGTGGLMRLMKQLGKIVGVDYSEEAVGWSKKRHLKVEKASVEKLPFRARTFDLVTCIDVLYHQNVNDVRALREFFRVLKPGGILIVRVPADKSLVSLHDKFVHTRERYGKEELNKKIVKAGFKVRLVTYIHSPLWPLVKLQAIKEMISQNRMARSGVNRVPRLINGVLIWLLDREADWVMTGWRPLMGIGIIAVAEKPSGRPKQ